MSDSGVANSFCHLNLNLPGTPYTSERVLRGVRVEMARKKNMRENKMINKIYAFLVSENLMWNLEFEPVKCVLLHFWCNCDSTSSQKCCTDQCHE